MIKQPSLQAEQLAHTVSELFSHLPLPKAISSGLNKYSKVTRHALHLQDYHLQKAVG